MQSYTVCIYGSGQPYIYAVLRDVAAEVACTECAAHCGAGLVPRRDCLVQGMERRVCLGETCMPWRDVCALYKAQRGLCASWAFKCLCVCMLRVCVVHIWAVLCS